MPNKKREQKYASKNIAVSNSQIPHILRLGIIIMSTKSTTNPIIYVIKFVHANANSKEQVNTSCSLNGFVLLTFLFQFVKLSHESRNKNNN